ncbi:DUF3293 domain-containing protein [bacterium]|nr:DUF3293 domain-containing protein [bacterium]
MPSYELLAAHCRTDYRVELPDRHFSIRPGQTCAELDALLRSVGATCWVLITAENPRSEQLSDSANATCREQLRKQLEQTGRPLFPTIAVSPDSTWPPELGHLTLGLPESTALTIARQFNQHAILSGEIGQPATLRFTTPAAWHEALLRGAVSDDPAIRTVSETARIGSHRPESVINNLDTPHEV